MNIRPHTKSLLVFLRGVILLLIGFLPAVSFSASVDELRQQLQSELASLEQQIQTQETTISELRGQTETLRRDINIMDQEIKKIRLELTYRELTIKKLTSQIQDRSTRIDDLHKKLEELQGVAREYLRTLYTEGQQSIVVMLLKNRQFSDFFSAVYAIENTQGKLQLAIGDMRETKTILEGEKAGLEEERSEEEELRIIQESQRKSLVAKEREKQSILKITKGKESEFRKVLEKNRQTAATIRSRLFLLEGSPSIPFSKALEYANFAAQATGVRAAFILGTLRYESELGANVGRGNWKEDLAHPRCASQREAFQKITSELGLNPDLMPVSRRQSYGYCGGAMGPAQFIPTTWLLYRDRIAAVVGKNPPNPWDPQTAFVAAALLLKDNGGVGSYANERIAALKYFAGRNWAKPAYRFYGDNVMAFAQDYQEQINLLNSIVSR